MVTTATPAVNPHLDGPSLNLLLLPLLTPSDPFNWLLLPLLASSNPFNWLLLLPLLASSGYLCNQC